MAEEKKGNTEYGAVRVLPVLCRRGCKRRGYGCLAQMN